MVHQGGLAQVLRQAQGAAPRSLPAVRRGAVDPVLEYVGYEQTTAAPDGARHRGRPPSLGGPQMTQREVAAGAVSDYEAHEFETSTEARGLAH